jgi:hypothetical protein
MPTIDVSQLPSYVLLFEDIEATCTVDGWKKKFKFVNGMRLRVGDPLPRGEDPNFDTCMRCKRKSMRVTKVPEAPSPLPPRGFWRVPTE